LDSPTKTARENTLATRIRLLAILFLISPFFIRSLADELSHPRLLADRADIDSAKSWIANDPWYRQLFEQHKAEIDNFLAHGPIHISPIKQIYQYQMYTCPRHGVDLMFEEFKPFEHRCPKDTAEIYRGGKYDMAWAGWYNRLLANHLVWMGLLYNAYGDAKYAAAGKEILMGFAHNYLAYPTDNTILGPAHVFFGTLSESFWGVDMAYGYDLLYTYGGFSPQDRIALKDSLFYPLARITQKFPESASNRQLWYNNVSAAVGFLYGDRELIEFAIDGTYGFRWQLGSALPESGFWAEWSGYHFVALRAMIHLAEMARHNGYDLYRMEIAGRSMKKMFDVPFQLILPNFEFPRSKDSGGGSILEYAPYYEVGYAVYRDPVYLALLNATHVRRGVQVVGETSALGRESEPVTPFALVPDLPQSDAEFTPTTSVNLEGNGFAILRNDSPQTYLYLDYGIMGGEHGHPDRLQMGYYAGGRNWIVDPLNESYMNPNLQLWYRQTIAHNTLVVDQTSQTWTNGYGNFFGALPFFQVASGGSTTAYPGVELTRTLMQVGDYFVDLFDAKSPDTHIYDYPLHSFGTLSLSGVAVEQQPNDLFGNRPGIPGYDQLTEIFAGETNTAWSGLFADKGRHLSVHALGEQGTRVFKAMTPPIGGFYKQMVSDQIPLPMILARRITDSTRFACLLQESEALPAATVFQQDGAPGAYRVTRGPATDAIFADIDNSLYWVLRKVDKTPSFFAGFNVQQIHDGAETIMSSRIRLASLQCAWRDSILEVVIPHQFDNVRIRAPRVSRVILNGVVSAFTRTGSDVIVSQHTRFPITVPSPRDTVMFLGRQNSVRVAVCNPAKTSVTEKVTILLADDWRARVQSQLTWWGGIVNLVAINKGSVERTVFPSTYTENASWIDRRSSETKTIPPGGMEVYSLTIDVPNEAAPVKYPALLVFGDDTLRTTFVVEPPVRVRMKMPNGKPEQLETEFTNRTSEPLTVSSELWFHPAWNPAGRTSTRVSLRPNETKTTSIRVHHAGSARGSESSPVRLSITCGDFRQAVERDFYVGVAHFAKTPPALDGSWRGWDRSNPMRIMHASQIGKLLFGNQPWGGPPDLSASISVMYDDQYLYVGAEVRDDSLVTHWDFPRMSYPWDTDCMEVVLDTRTGSGQGYDPPTPGLFRHLSLAEYRETDFSAVLWQGGGAGGPLLPKPNLVPDGQTYFRRSSNGYTMIARYPLSRLDSEVTTPGFKIGFDVAINDNDGTNYRRNQHIWAGYNQNQSWWDMGTIGALVFGPK
jgi:hypothetical protein